MMLRLPDTPPNNPHAAHPSAVELRPFYLSRNPAIKQTFAWLQTTFPQTFPRYLHEVKPLKKGIRDDILAVLNTQETQAPQRAEPAPARCLITPAQCALALRLYTHSTPYLLRLKTGAPRVDLSGVVSGKVTATDAEYAKQRLASQATKRTNTKET